MKDSLEDQFQGVVWVQHLFGLEPEWTIEPDLEKIEHTILSLRPESTVSVSFLAQGGLNRIYVAKVDDQDFVMRVALPVDPYYKTMSEVSTMAWISHITDIPIPRVLAYQTSRANLIGFEWILMTKASGTPLADAWHSLSFPAKRTLVKQFVVYSARLFQNKLQRIGNIYEKQYTADGSPLDEGMWPAEGSVYSNASALNESKIPGPPDVGRIVSMDFFWGPSIQEDVHRGPFNSSKDWMLSRLLLEEKSHQSKLSSLPSSDLDPKQEARKEDATRTLDIIGKLKNLLSLVFQPIEDNPEDSPEPSIIVHDDLSSRNILVQDNGELAAVLDWECVATLPLWAACNYPAFLEGPNRRTEPDRTTYGHEEDGEPCDLYLEHLENYELTLLRGVFMDTMRALEPGWVDVFEESQRERDFDYAVRSCDNVFEARAIREWIENVTSGDNPEGLCERIDKAQEQV
ncbi:hypothetical protein N7466_009341 [Penicillium verhagenii]|uniref:uncharacterized protein n=1 Tax=Penicillium verhagenii TaxID=1562060 RepID=UPI002545451B|nr:uncharacterized protein N7466_009341 [Penicillium verhagenii]KAJ5921015.1 hypothetical protein N7466_009341 [Penicillium verhagenii]